MFLPRMPVLVLATLLSSALSAPVQQHVADKPILRAKRAEEIMFGNHQNSARVKKTDPGMNTIGDEAPVIDKQASLDDQTSPVDDAIAPLDRTDTEGDDVDQLIASLKAEPQVAEENVNELESTAEENDLATLQGQKEEDTLGSLKTDNEVEEAEEGSEASDTEGDLTEDEEEAEEEVPVEQDEETLSLDAEPSKQQYKDPYATESWYDYFNNDGYYPNPYYGAEDAEGDRRKRSAKAEVPLTAENMMEAPAAPQRFKRDLTEDELREWLEEEAGLQPSEAYYPQYEQEEEVYIPEETAELQPSEGALLERLLEAEEEGESWDYEPDIVEQADEAEYYPQAEEDTIDTDAEARAKLALLRYLYDELPDQVEEAQEEEEELYDPYPEEQENWEDFQPAQEVEYQPIVYEGVPGIFIPVKRQYLSMMPGIRKRGSDFYPYNYEPSSAGRWGAMVPEVNEQKRNAEAYDRLYRMAQALKRRDDDWFKKR